MWSLFFAFNIFQTLAEYPKCECQNEWADKPRVGYCVYESGENNPLYFLICDGTAKQCAWNIEQANYNDTQPNCSCLGFCTKTFSTTNTTCDKYCYSECVENDVGACSNDDDNQNMCILYCVNYCEFAVCSHDGPLPGSCEADCSKYMGDFPSEDSDTVEYADCMYECTQPVGLRKKSS